MVKTVIIPAAGKATRLGKVGLAIPKIILPYNGEPVIDYMFEMLQQIGVKNVILIVGWKKEAILSYLEDSSSYDMNICFVLQPKSKGIADAVLRAEPFIKEDDFLVVLGDTLLFPKDALKILDGTNQVMATKVEDPTKHGMVEFYGVLKYTKESAYDGMGNLIDTTDANGHLIRYMYDKSNRLNELKETGSELHVTQIVEKPESWDLSKSALGICGAYRFNHKIFDAIRGIKPNEKTGELEISDAINKMIEKGEEVKVKVFEGTYIDMGRVLQKHENEGSTYNLETFEGYKKMG